MTTVPREGNRDPHNRKGDPDPLGNRHYPGGHQQKADGGADDLDTLLPTSSMYMLLGEPHAAEILRDRAVP